MKTDNQNRGNNQSRNTGKQQQTNQPKQHTNIETEKKGTYIKDMPPIDGARPGVI
ncbi:hypothetical protein [Mucilaginibacter panaciglaebae]|uniref:Uncharacterized protein n=1 Tax=Mucilaginibacter panaciglaebae TaxID=502331 RepID=A0ABP7WG32_9SPHI